MGIFGSKFGLTEQQTKKLNSLLPEHLQKKEFVEDDFKTLSIYTKHKNLRRIKAKKIDDLVFEQKELKEKIIDEQASRIKIFNTEIFDAKPIGMVDAGEIHQFSAPSTGDRFAGGLIGYAIEQATDNVWAKASNQENAVNKVKLKLLKKALTIYPNTNMIFKYDVDFREMGSSGNVFIYMRGTAADGDNKEVLKVKKEQEKKIELISKEIQEIKIELKDLISKANLIPQSIKEIKDKL